MFGRPSRHTRHRLEENGRRAVATVLEAGARGMAITTGSGQLVSDTEVALKVKLRVEPEGEPAFEVETRMRFPQMALPSAGSKVAVIHDPDDHETIMRDESPAATVQAAMGNAPAAMRDIAAQVVAAASNGASREEVGELARRLGQQYGARPMPEPGLEDPLERLQKLADLRDRGVLTEEEFQAQKTRILGSS